MKNKQQLDRHSASNDYAREGLAGACKECMSRGSIEWLLPSQVAQLYRETNNRFTNGAITCWSKT